MTASTNLILGIANGRAVIAQLTWQLSAKRAVRSAEICESPNRFCVTMNVAILQT